MNVPLTPIRFKQRAEQLYGDKIGVICGGGRFTYREFGRRCDRLSHGLDTLRVASGDVVAYLAFNCHRLLEGYFGVLQTGAVLLPMNVRLAKEDFIFILNDSESRVLFFDSAFTRTVAEIRPALKSIEHFVPLDVQPGEPWCTGYTYDEMLEGSDPNPYPAQEPDEDSVAELFYTSGTTAQPKGVMLTHRNLYLHALGTIIGLDTRDTEITLHTIPLFHVNGWGAPQCLTCMGGTHVMIQKFDPGRVLRMVAEERITSMSLVPTMANALLNHPDLTKYDLSSMRLVTLGGAAAVPATIEKLERVFGCLCVLGYGLTESSPVLTLATIKAHLRALPKEERQRRQAMTGVPLVGVDLRVVDHQDRDVRPDGEQVGEIIARADCVMKGYWKQPEETAGVLRGGWLRTGDMATVDDQGYYQIVDRKKDIIISGGENIASIEVESCLVSHPGVYECAVIAVPDEKWGESPKALVVLREGAQVTEEELIEFCRGRLAGYKCPRSVSFFDSLPKGGTGKILKRPLREVYWKDQNRRVHG